MRHIWIKMSDPTSWHNSALREIKSGPLKLHVSATSKNVRIRIMFNKVFITWVSSQNDNFWWASDENFHQNNTIPVSSTGIRYFKNFFSDYSDSFDKIHVLVWINAAWCADLWSIPICDNNPISHRDEIQANQWTRRTSGRLIFVMTWKLFPVIGPLCGEFTGELPSQRASNADFDVSLTWVSIRC